MQDDSALDRAVAMVADLRARCPWDRLQSRQTLRPYLIEEAHELAAALADDDPPSPYTPGTCTFRRRKCSGSLSSVTTAR
jgi:NTP pyrophosphatase (non-canonical NTP hydrolase)